MPTEYDQLSTTQRNTAIQRLTALWAFCESGLGGVMHALQMPFTGLVIGGLAVIIISFIARLSNNNYNELLQSLVIVLIVKGMVSPYTPFPAYIAVSFQASLGIVLFKLLRVNLVSILLLSVIAMLESAIQQLLILTIFFGQSLWRAMDSMADLVTKQLGIAAVNGSQWIIGIYLLLYVTGGILIALMAHKIIIGFFRAGRHPELYDGPQLNDGIREPDITDTGNTRHKLWLMAILLFVLSIAMFVFASNTKQGWIAVIKTLSWTLSAIMAWYLIIGPLFTRCILWMLKKKESRYHEKVSATLSFIPVLRRLTSMAWQKSNPYKGWSRWQFFFSTLIHWSLTYTELPVAGDPIKNPL